jgi:hypothetical protein
VDPYHLGADPDLALYFNADPDPDFHFNADPDPDPASHQIDGIMRLLVCRPSRAPF